MGARGGGREKKGVGVSLTPVRSALVEWSVNLGGVNNLKVFNWIVFILLEFLFCSSIR